MLEFFMSKPNYHRLPDLAGQVFTHLTVLSKAGKDAGSNRLWLCRCSCGVEKVIRGFQLTNGTTKSCGCLQKKATIERNTTHGRSRDGVYEVWRSMWSRCTNPNHKAYASYKDRTPPERWRSFENFIADMGERPSDAHTLERVDNNEPYGPANCVWATRVEQNNNTSRNRVVAYKGVSKNVTQWAKETGINYGTLTARLGRLGWAVGEALGFESRIHGNTKDS